MLNGLKWLKPLAIWTEFHSQYLKHFHNDYNEKYLSVMTFRYIFTNFRAVYDSTSFQLFYQFDERFSFDSKISSSFTRMHVLNKVEEPPSVHLLHHPDQPLSECQVSLLPLPVSTMKADADGEKAEKVAFKKRGYVERVVALMQTVQTRPSSLYWCLSGRMMKAHNATQARCRAEVMCETNMDMLHLLYAGFSCLWM